MYNTCPISQNKDSEYNELFGFGFLSYKTVTHTWYPACRDICSSFTQHRCYPSSGYKSCLILKMEEPFYENININEIFGYEL